MTTAQSWTAPRRRALRAFVLGYGVARESNKTDLNVPRKTVYWQTLNWLRDQGLVEPLPGEPTWYRLTEAGRQAAHDLGIET